VRRPRETKKEIVIRKTPASASTARPAIDAARMTKAVQVFGEVLAKTSTAAA
jgi:hypothetical protein